MARPPNSTAAFQRPSSPPVIVAAPVCCVVRPDFVTISTTPPKRLPYSAEKPPVMTLAVSITSGLIPAEYAGSRVLPKRHAVDQQVQPNLMAPHVNEIAVAPDHAWCRGQENVGEAQPLRRRQLFNPILLEHCRTGRMRALAARETRGDHGGYLEAC